MTETREDPRIPLTSGSIIRIRHKLNDIKTETIYVVEACIASGGQALLYKCRNLVGHPYCIKEYYPFEAIRNEESDDKEIVPVYGWNDIRNGLQISQKLARSFAPASHQALFLPVDADDERMVEVMPYATNDCCTLGEYVARWDSECSASSETRIKKAVQIIDSLLTVLIKLHEFTGENNELQGLVHRDINPGNILWAENDDHTGVAFPIDFSCCAKKNENNSDCQSFSPGFSHPYLTDASIQVDLYSVAAVLVFLTKGSEIYDMFEDLNLPDLTDEWTIWKIIETLDIPAGVKRKLGRIIQKATTLEENEQYSSAYEMREDIKALLEIIERKGMYPECLFDASNEEFEKQCRDQGVFCYAFDRDLLTMAVDSKSRDLLDPLKQNTILTGPGGSGKTTCIRDLYKKCLETWEKDPENTPIPVYVPLNTFERDRDFYIRDYILEKHFPNLSLYIKDPRKALMGMFDSIGRYVLFLDGINEAVDSDKLNEEIAAFAAIENVTVLITSRNELGDGWSETKKWFSIAELMPLDDNLIIQKLQKKGLGSPSRRLMEALRRPMFLALYLKLKITDKQVETPGQILLEHHRHMRDSYKTGHHGAEWEIVVKTALDEVLPRLASQMNKMQFGEEELGKILIDLFDKYKSSITFKQAEMYLSSKGYFVPMQALTVFQNCGIIRCCGNKEYVFTHQNYLEFYQAFDVYCQMGACEKGGKLPQCLCESVLSVPISRYLGEIWGEASFESKVNCIENASPIEKWMQTNLGGKQGDQAQLAVKNCIDIMKLTRNYYITANYSNLDLSLVTFYNCFLPNSVFSRAKINDHLFLNIGHRHFVEHVAFISKKNWLITTSQQEMFFWDLASGTFIDKVSCEGSITHIAVSENEELIAVGLSEEGSLPVQIFRTQDRSLVTKVIFWEDAQCPENVVYDDLSSCRWEHTSTMLCFLSDDRTLLCEIGEEGLESIDVLGDKKPRHPYTIEDYHSQELITCAISPDKTIIACAPSSTPTDCYSENHVGVISLWNAKLGIFIKAIPLGDLGLKSIAFTTDGECIIGCDWFHKFHKWKIDGGEHTTLFCSNSSKFAMVDGHIVTEEGLYDIANNHMKQLPSEVTIRPSNIYSDMHGTRFAITTSDETVSVFCVGGNHLQRKIQVGANRWHVWQKGPAAVSCSKGSVVRISACGELDKLNSHTESMQRLISRKHGFNPNVDKVSSFHILADEYYLRVSPRETELTVWVLASGEQFSFDGDFSDLVTAKFFTEEKQLITVDKAGVISIGKLGEERQYFSSGNIAGRYPSIIVKDKAVVGTPSGEIVLCSSKGKLEIRQAHHTAITQVYAVVDGDYFFTQAVDRSMKIWRMNDLQSWVSKPVSKGGSTGIITQSKHKISWQNTGDLQVYQYVLPDIVLFWYEYVKSIFLDATVSKDGKRIAVTDRDSIWIYNTEKGIEQLYIKELPDGLSSIRLSCDGTILTAAFHDLSVKIFNTVDGTEFTWAAIDAEDISQCDFRGTDMEGWLQKVLKQNGAIVDDTYL